MTREEAIKRGLIRYLPDKPCRQGHLSERYTSTGNCLECIATTRRRIEQGRNARAQGWPTITTQVPHDRIALLRACLSILRHHGPAGDAMRVRLAAGVDELTRTGPIPVVDCLKIESGFRPVPEVTP